MNETYEDKLKRYITEHHIQAEHLTFTQSTHSVAEAAEAVGATAADFVKSICLISKAGDVVVAIIKGEDRADRGAVQRLLGLAKLSIASPTEMLEKTGFPAGGTPPFGFAATYVMDERVFERAFVYAGGGSAQALIRIKPDELRRVNGAQIGIVRQAN